MLLFNCGDIYKYLIMNTSTLKFYITDLRVEKRMLVEDMQFYLNSIRVTDTKIVTLFQYIKHKIDNEIKVDMNIGTPELPVDLDPATNFPFNYMSIKNSNENYEIYYFIQRSEWRSNSCVRLTLRMDILNSFPQFVNNFSNKTYIERCHVHDLMENPAKSGDVYTFKRDIDYVDEQLNPKLHRQTKSILKQYNSSDSYYLVYKAEHDLDDSEHIANPLSCELYSKNGGLQVTAKNIRVNPARIRQDIYFYITSAGTNWYIGTSGGNNKQYESQYIVGHEIEVAGVGVIIDAIVFKGIINSQSGFSFNVSVVGHETISGNNYFGTIDPETSDGYYLFIYDTNQIALKWYSSVVTYTQIRTLPVYNLSIKPLAGFVDITDAKLVKIIEIPYLPIASESAASILLDDDNWEYEFDNGLGYFRLLDPTKEFSEVIIQENVSLAQNNFFVGYNIARTTTFNELFMGDYNYDSKLLNSSFFKIKITYDSFSKEYPLEAYNVSLLSKANAKFIFSFKMTSTINSTMGFKVALSSYPVDSDFFRLAYEDYPEWLVANRNNEKTIYTSNYLNYLRTGYNYDKKSKTLGELQSGAGIAIGAIGGASQGGPVGAVVGALTGGANFVLNLIKTENAWSSKISQLKEQTLNVSGADDLDIFNAYGDNKLILYKYVVNPQVEKQLLHLFEYYGYARRTYGIPDLHTRVFWDHIQCNPVFNNFKVEDIEVSGEIESEIIRLCQVGITIIHPVFDGRGGNTIWDIKQEYKNLDKYIYDIYANM